MEKEKGEKKMVKQKKEFEENHWTDECEELLAEWSEKASCYRWLHGRCEKSYRKWYYCFSIPVIILSTLTGAANVGMDSFVPADSKSIASAIVGGVNIFAGIISTLQNFLKVAELMEGHRIAGVSWGKLQRNIAIELALDPSRRVSQSDFLKISRAEYDRLIEAGPLIDDGIIAQFNSKFKNYEVCKPSICNGLDKCTIYKLDPSVKINQRDFMEGIEDVIINEEIDNDTKVDLIKKVKDIEKKEEAKFRHDIHLDDEVFDEETKEEEIVENVQEVIEDVHEVIEEKKDIQKEDVEVNNRSEKIKGKSSEDVKVEVIINVTEPEPEPEPEPDQNTFLEGIEDGDNNP